MVENQNTVCFRTLHLDQPYTLESYRSVGGYAQWEKILKEKPDPERHHRRSQALGAARARRRGLSNRTQVELHAA